MLSMVPMQGEGRPPWVVPGSRNTLEVWYDELIDTFQCDEVAICELLLLAQLSDAGYIEANSVISQLFKSKSDNRPIANPSAFMHRCCLTHIVF